jgi:hypothetical protein
MSCLPTVRVINGRNNTDGVVFGMVEGAAAELYDFTSITRMTLTFDVDGTETVIDSALEPTAITWGTTNGEVTFDLGDQAIPAGTYITQLVVYAAAYPDGYLMDVGESGYSFNLVVI